MVYDKKSKKNLNVPNLRFKEFSGEWERYNCYDILVNFPTNSLSWDKLSYNSKTQIYNLHYGLIHNGAPTLIDCSMYQLPNIIEANTKKQEPIINGDVVFTDASEDTNDIGKAVEFINIDNKTIFAGLHTIHVREKLNLTIIGFKGYLFHSRNFHKQVERITQGSKVYSLNFNNFKELYVNIPNHKEQQKIANFLSLIDKRIETQIKIIEEYKSLIILIQNQIIKSHKTNKYIKLKDLCTISTGKLDANAMVNDGEYKFFTCSKEDYYIDKYAFDGESLIISGNGELGLIKYYNGKFNAYQRTYVLQNFKINPIYLKFMMEYHLKRKIHKEKNVGAMPYIVLNTLADLEIPILDKKTENNIHALCNIYSIKMELEYNTLKNLILEKRFLLNNMFI